MRKEPRTGATDPRLPVRKPAVAGSFYPSSPETLTRVIDSSYTHPLGPGSSPPGPPGDSNVVAVLAPHAGYEYSGPVAAHSYLHVSSLRDPDLLVVVAPNHYGIGSGVSTYKEGYWETPLGRLLVDSQASSALVKAGVASYDPDAHRLEHSLEVQLPFLQRLYGDSVPLLPISLVFQDSDTTEAVAEALAQVLRGRKVVLVASSDLTHYEPAEVARAKDIPLLEKVTKMDVDGFYSTLERLQVTACGFGAIATVMRTASSLGLRHGELLKYATSGDTTGDNLQVVGYAAARFVSH
ncbi:MAG TPA: AmmeMemoRadiSam system protein B [Nitrososphaerales archaeon]|nr:AmmeMemoRadiSam system protein B [Nitrososphaerales archaeon]